MNDFVFIISDLRNFYNLFQIIYHYSKKNIIVYIDDELLESNGKRFLLNKESLNLLNKYNIRHNLLSEIKLINTKYLVLQHNINFNFKSIDVTFKKSFMICGLANFNIDKYEIINNQINLNKILIYDLNFFKYKYGSNKIFSKKIKDIGVINNKLSFDNLRYFKFDWLILVPTSFAFKNYESRYIFFRNILDFVKGKKKDMFVFKNHNSLNFDLFGNFLLSKYIFSKFLSLFIFKKNDLFFKYKFYELIFKLKKNPNIVDLKKISKFSGLSAEFFIPFTNKGVVGGFSNTYATSLLLKKNYICLQDSPTNMVENPNININNKNSKIHLDLNLTFFDIKKRSNDLLNSKFNLKKYDFKNLFILNDENQ